MKIKSENRKNILGKNLLIVGCVITLSIMCVGCTGFDNLRGYGSLYGGEQQESSKDYKMEYHATKNEGIEAFNNHEYYSAYELLNDALDMAERYDVDDEQGIKDIYYCLGTMYYEGYYVEQNYRKAVECYEKGTADDVFMAGIMYINGTGVEKDSDRGMELVQKAADEGSEEALEFLTSLEESKNVFEDPNATQYHMNNVHLQPRLVYWDNGTLVAECVLTNGFVNNAVWNINVKEITIKNEDGTIAAAYFGVLPDASINAYGYLVWTFRFGPDCVYQQNADLSVLNTTYNVTYSY